MHGWRAPQHPGRGVGRALRAAAAAVALAPLPLRAQPTAPNDRPAFAQRTVRVFDFEERETNPFPIPHYWVRAQEDRAVPRVRPGFPLWNEAVIDEQVAHTGGASVRLPTRGGSTSLLLDPGVIPVFGGADYVVSAMVRTEGLSHARAVLAARFLDRENQPIEASEARSELVRTAGGWRPVAVRLSGEHPGAAFLQLELMLLQPREFAEPSLPDRHQVWPEDLSGAAWFDDVIVSQLPSVELSTNSQVNIVAAPETPEITLRTRDLTGEALRAVITVQDLDGRVVDRAERALTAGDGDWVWRPRLGALGWYRASLDLFGPTARVGSTYTDLAWVPPPPLPPARGGDTDNLRFGLILERPTPSQARHIPAMVSLTGAGAATIPVWDRSLNPTRADLLNPILPAADGLLADGRQVTFSLPEAPASLVAAGPRTDRPLALIAADRKRWGAYLLPLLDKYGQTVHRWQFGPTTPEPREAAVPRSELALVRSTLSRFVPGPTLSIPFAADAALDLASLGDGVAGVAVVPAAMPPEAMPDLAAALAAHDQAGTTRDLTLVFEPLSAKAHGRRDIARDLVKRTVLFWAAFASDSAAAPPVQVAIAQPWTWGGRRGSVAQPTVELAVWRTLTERLAGRRIVGELPVADGVRCFILAPAPDAPPGRTGALIAWRETAPPELAVIDAFLGVGPVEAVDPFGNSRTLEPASSSAAAGNAYRIPVGHTPVFIEGVDVGIARFVASFKLEPGFAPSDGRSHLHEMVLVNPWPVRIDGMLSVVEPGGYGDEVLLRDRTWKIAPRTTAFSIEPGATARLPLSITFSPVEEAGIKDLVVEIDLAADRDYSGLRLRAPLEVGHETLHLDLAWRIAGQELVIEAHVTNKSGEPATLEVAAFAPGAARARASISDLPPGSSVARRFPFPDASSLRGKRIVVSVEDIDTNARLTRSVLIE